MSDVVVVDEKDAIIGTMPKQKAHEDGTPHRIAIVYVEKMKGKFSFKRELRDT